MKQKLMNRKNILFILFSLFIFVPVSAGTLNNVVFFIIPGVENYLMVHITSSQNLVRTQYSDINLTIWKMITDDPNYKVLYPNATITANITSPSGSKTALTFTNYENGNYTNSSWNFNQIGTWVLDIKADNESVGYTTGRAFIYVGRFPIYCKIISETEYITEELGLVSVYVNDADDNPITTATGNLTLYYPNLTVWHYANMTHLENGIYYYSFMTPTTEGMYIAWVNMTSATGISTFDSKTFHVSPLLSNITDTVQTEGSVTRNYLEDTIRKFSSVFVSFQEAGLSGMVTELKNFVYDSSNWPFILVGFIILLILLLLLKRLWDEIYTRIFGGNEK